MTFVFEKKSSLVSLKKQLKNFKVRVVWDADLIDFSKKKVRIHPHRGKVGADRGRRTGPDHRNEERIASFVLCFAGFFRFHA